MANLEDDDALYAAKRERMQGVLRSAVASARNALELLKRKIADKNENVDNESEGNVVSDDSRSVGTRAALGALLLLQDEGNEKSGLESVDVFGQAGDDAKTFAAALSALVRANHALRAFPANATYPSDLWSAIESASPEENRVDGADEEKEEAKQNGSDFCPEREQDRESNAQQNNSDKIGSADGNSVAARKAWLFAHGVDASREWSDLTTATSFAEVIRRSAHLMLWECSRKLDVLDDYVLASNSMNKLVLVGKILRGVRGALSSVSIEDLDRTLQPLPANPLLIVQQRAKAAAEADVAAAASNSIKTASYAAAATMSDAVSDFDTALAELMATPAAPDLNSAAAAARTRALELEVMALTSRLAAADSLRIAVETTVKSLHVENSALKKDLNQERQYRWKNEGTIQELHEKIRLLQDGSATADKSSSVDHVALASTAPQLDSLLKEMTTPDPTLDSYRPPTPSTAVHEIVASTVSPSSSTESTSSRNESITSSSTSERTKSTWETGSLADLSDLAADAAIDNMLQLLAPEAPAVVLQDSIDGHATALSKNTNEMKVASSSPSFAPRASISGLALDDFDALLDELTQPDTRTTGSASTSVKTAAVASASNFSQAPRDASANVQPSIAQPAAVSSEGALSTAPKIAGQQEQDEFDAWLADLSGETATIPSASASIKQSHLQQTGTTFSAERGGNGLAHAAVATAAPAPLKNDIRAIAGMSATIADSVELKVNFNGEIETILVGLGPTTVAEATIQIASQHPGVQKQRQGTAMEVEYGLFEPFPIGTWLTPTLAMSKYGLKNGHEIELRVKGATGYKRQDSSTGENWQFVKVEVPDTTGTGGVTQTHKLSKDKETVRDLMDRVTRKVAIENPEDWALAIPSQPLRWLDPDAALADIEMEHMQTLHLRLKPMNGVFGVAPQSLPQTDEDPNGFIVPAVLFEIKAQLYMSNGLEKRGIFRVGGDPSRVRTFRHLINMDLDWQSSVSSGEDRVALAALLKQWFAALPQRLFDTVRNLEQFSSPSAAPGFPQELVDPARSLFLWLVDLLRDASRYEESNKMSSRDLALMCGPTLISTNAMSEGEALSKARAAALILYYHLSPGSSAAEFADGEIIQVDGFKTGRS